MYSSKRGKNINKKEEKKEKKNIHSKYKSPNNKE